MRPQPGRGLLSLAVLVAVVLGLQVGFGSWQTHRDGSALRELVRPGDIVMLSSTTCIYCERARRWLTEQRVPHRECFIETDPACRAEFQARGALGTPTLVVRGHTLLGFDRARLLKMLSRPAAG